MSRYAKRTLVAHELYSSHLSEERTVKVYLPPGYAENGRYPTLYCHDGNEFFTHGRIATIANMLISEGRLSPLLIVGIATRRSMRNADYAPIGERHASYVDFVLNECVPFIEEAYPADPNPEKRFMAGVSLGAAASMSIFAENPESFFKLLLFSGAFIDFMQSTGRSAPADPAVAPHVAARQDWTKGASRLAAYMVVGTDERAVETPSGAFDFLAANRAMRASLQTAGADIAYREAEGTHVWGFWQRHFPDALEWLNVHL